MLVTCFAIPMLAAQDRQNIVYRDIVSGVMIHFGSADYRQLSGAGLITAEDETAALWSTVISQTVTRSKKEQEQL